MKQKILLIAFTFIFSVTAFANMNYVAKVLADEKGNILAGENATLEHPLASLTKMMTVLVVLEKVERGEISLTSTVTISKAADKLRGSSAHLREGYKLTVDELVKAAIIHSGNDAAYALAEYVGGTEESFVKLMNEKAHELGLKNTVYHSATGLPRPDNQLDSSTPEDMAKLAAEILRHPKYLECSSLPQFYISTLKTPLSSTNKLIGKYEGADGMKTGYHDKAGYNMIATAKRGDRRFIVIAFGCPSDRIRELEVAKMLDYGFDNFERITIAKKGDFVANIAIKGGKSKKIDVVLGEDLNVFINKSDAAKITKTAYISKDLKAPLGRGESVGVLSLQSGNRVIGEYQIVTVDEVKKLSLLGSILRFITFNLL